MPNQGKAKQVSLNGKRQFRHHRRAGRRTEKSNSRPSSIHVGRNLHQLRVARALSLRALAELSGLNINTISLIENDKCSPSISTLQQLATALAVPIITFFEPHHRANNVSCLKAGQRSRVIGERNSLEDLAVGSSLRNVQPFVMTLKPHTDSGVYPLVHTGLELVYCLNGRLSYEIEEQVYLLEPDDSLLFEANLPHRWRNLEDNPSRWLLVLCPSNVESYAVGQHFLYNIPCREIV